MTSSFGRARTATPAADVALEAPIALLMGTLNERLDLAILEAVAGTGISLLIVGPQSPRFASSAFDALVGVPGVQWVGAKDFRELPAYVAHASVGLVPYTHSKFNEGSFPLKTLEYLAAGIPVVATDLPAIRWLGSPDVVVEEEPEAFARRVAECHHRRPRRAADGPPHGVREPTQLGRPSARVRHPGAGIISLMPDPRSPSAFCGLILLRVGDDRHRGEPTMTDVVERLIREDPRFHSGGAPTGAPCPAS